MENLTYIGLRSFLQGIKSVGKDLGDWAWNQLLITTRINMEMVIGGEKVLVADGTHYLSLVMDAAREGKLTDEEIEDMIEQLNRISLIYNSIHAIFFANKFTVSQAVTEQKIKLEDVVPETTVENIEKVVDNTEVSDNISVVTEANTSEVVPPKRGRKPKQ